MRGEGAVDWADATLVAPPACRAAFGTADAMPARSGVALRDSTATNAGVVGKAGRGVVVTMRPS
ncbi:hypothetical protein SY91_03521 [Burkholderia cenocepacia]|nr:hypothetical protein SY91_03521 [Burkholderia cenocepacia]